MVRLNPSTFCHLLTILRIKKQNVPHEIISVCTKIPHKHMCFVIMLRSRTDTHTWTDTMTQWQKSKHIWISFAIASPKVHFSVASQSVEPLAGLFFCTSFASASFNLHFFVASQSVGPLAWLFAWSYSPLQVPISTFLLLLRPLRCWLSCLSEIHSPMQVRISTFLLLRSPLNRWLGCFFPKFILQFFVASHFVGALT